MNTFKCDRCDDIVDHPTFISFRDEEDYRNKPIIKHVCKKCLREIRDMFINRNKIKTETPLNIPHPS